MSDVPPSSHATTATADAAWCRPGHLLGFAFGGFFDGILLHQVLQWHHLLTDAGEPMDTVDGLEANTLADGLFHGSTWVVTVAGTVLFVRAWQRGERAPPSRAYFALLICGWGVFNVVEGLIDHQILGVHHVNERVPEPQRLLWDMGFLVWGAAMLIGGWLLVRSGRRETRPAR